MKFKHIKTRLAVTMSILAIIMLMSAGTVLAYLYSEEMLSSMYTITDQNLQLTNKVLEEKLDDVYGLFDTLQNDEVLQQWVNVRPESDLETFEKMRGISTLLREYAYADIGIMSIFLLDEVGQVQDPLYITEPYSNIVDSYDDLNKYKNEKSTSRFSGVSHFPSKLEAEPGDKSTITYFDTYLSKSDYSNKGTILITSRVDHFFQEFKAEAKSKFDSVIIVDEMNRPILQYGEEYPLDRVLDAVEDIQKTNGIVNFDKNSYYYNLRQLDSYPDWTVVGIVSYDKFRTDINTIWDLLLIILLGSIVIIVLTALFVSNKITVPILALGQAMKQVSQGEWPEPIHTETEDELKDLIDGFNDMVDEQQELIDRIYEEEEKKKKLEVSAVQMKLDLLQSQINPHFIHNTLNAIQYTIMSDRIEDAGKMLKAFNMLLRASMSHDNDFITIREELDCLTSYAEIQKIRYDNIFEMELDVDSTLLSVKIPKLLLQPIVENAIFHGIVPKGVSGTVTVKIKENLNNIDIEISDDGVGMKEMEAQMLVDTVEKTYKGSFNRISFKNINNRLLLAYGNEKGLQINSVAGQGTVISFTISRTKR